MNLPPQAPLEPLRACLCDLRARVVANTPLCRAHVELDLALPEFPETHPGQFVAVRCSSAEDFAPHALSWPAGGFPSIAGSSEWAARTAFLRRPFSIADRWSDPGGHTRLTLISRTVGPGTAWLEQLRPGDTLSLTGPLGRGFRLPKPATVALLVGGGVGIPPLLYLARRLNELGRREVIAFFGATTRELLPLRLTGEPDRTGRPTPCVAWPAGVRYPAAVSSDDGSLGLRGLVTDALRRWAERDRSLGPPDVVVFACGPQAMLAAVAQITRELRWECQLCVERRMGCGLGTCLSCVLRVRDQSRPAGWRWGLACTDGPVFDRDQLVDYAATAGRPQS